ncbi:unnamed protein product [Dovyalis caffra]|uniref:PGG domain-containing protein n=1 Tax=Dovyalis caffra TaxID=77055 RepID=A0AAV1SEV3_9ROSI|nr:unnamed protein product [Dovyalis caffra]
MAMVPLLIEFDVSIVYIADKNKHRTALHVAAIKSQVDMVKEIASRCPDCCEQFDGKCWNALHYAAASKIKLRLRAFKESLEIPELAKLIIEKDENGNPPLLLLAAIDQQQPNIILDSIKAVRNEQVGPFMRLMKENKWKEISSIIYRGKDARLVAATLIATVTFAAAFTVSGGYKGEQGPNEGTAILIKNAAFSVFTISDAISLTMIAMGTMVLAFITGTFAVLAPSLVLATTTCLIGLCFFVIGFMLLKKTIEIKEDPCHHFD